MVGDIKQSIYRFRQAKPELFLNKYKTYSSNSGSNNRKIQLYKNFRSREEVISSVNYIFRQIMSVNAGELDYSKEEELNLGAEYKEYNASEGYVGGSTELHIIDDDNNTIIEDNEAELSDDNAETDEFIEDSKPSDDEIEEQLGSIQLEARMVVKRIKELTRPKDGEKCLKVFDKSTQDYRNVEYKDIVILLRTTRNWAEIFVEEMVLQGIPTYADSGTGYFKTIEVQVILSLLEIIDNPLQDIPLLAVLRSPIASFSAEELIDIRLADRDASLYEAMIKLSSQEDAPFSAKIKLFMRNLKSWREKAAYLSTDELIWFLYTDTGYFSYVGAMAAGEQRQANLRVLFERARQFEQTSYKGLFNFINFINKLKRSSGDMGSAKILGENENVVRIMSIHKSKGLEFPIVILSGCGKTFNLQDMNKKILLHQDMGFGPDLIDSVRRISYPTIQKQALRCKTKVESLSEEMRILYVAFTRAKEKLIITGNIKGLSRKAVKWANSFSLAEEKLPDDEMLRARNYMDWIGPALMRHKGSSNLRKLAGICTDASEPPLRFPSDCSNWEINIWSAMDFLSDRLDESIIDLKDGFEDIEMEHTNGSYIDIIKERLNWEYPYLRASTLPSKMSVTELKRHFNASNADEYPGMQLNTPALVKKPKFLEDVRGLNAAERGTTLHFVMQHLDLMHVSNINEIKQQLSKMKSLELLTDQQMKEIDLDRIDKFLKSEIGIRLLSAEKIYREVPFNIEINCGDIYKEVIKDKCSEETILLQGVIDCYFEEGDKLVLLDYKTDYIPEGGTERISERYRVQIEYYTKALESITSKKVSGKYIYLFWNGETYEFK
jgi:ATP-dependent helicase/nuclease subunit A